MEQTGKQQHSGLMSGRAAHPHLDGRGTQQRLAEAALSLGEVAMLEAEGEHLVSDLHGGGGLDGVLHYGVTVTLPDTFTATSTKPAARLDAVLSDVGLQHGVGTLFVGVA